MGLLYLYLLNTYNQQQYTELLIKHVHPNTPKTGIAASVALPAIMQNGLSEAAI
jgi:hypothetical protein